MDNVNFCTFKLHKSKHKIHIDKAMKQATPFFFQFPLQKKSVRNLKIVTEQVGMLEVEALGYFNPSASMLNIFERFSVDLEFVRWNGADIKPVLEVMGNLEEIEEAAVRYFASHYEDRWNKAA